MLIFVFLFLYWSNSSFFCFVTPTCFSLFSFCWSKYPVFQLFPQPSLLLSSSRWSKYSIFQLFPQYSLLLPSSCWSKYPVFQLFAPIQLASLVLPLEQMYCFLSLCPIPASSSSFTIGATTLHIHTLLQACLLVSSARWSKCTVFYLFAPIQSQSCLNPASTKPQINPRLHSDHPRSGLTSASSVYRWIHTSQVQIVQIQLPHL